MWELAIFIEDRIKTKKLRCLLEFDQSQRLELYVEFNAQKKKEAEKNGDKDGNALYKLMKNAIYGKTMEHLRNKVDPNLQATKKTI